MKLYLLSPPPSPVHPEPHMNGGNLVCHGCQLAIEDEYRLHVAPDLDWHAACLLCMECQTPLSERHTCIIREGRPYCRTDYIRLGRAM